jgi:peptide/nickel transport system ATP-binding protein
MSAAPLLAAKHVTVSFGLGADAFDAVHDASLEVRSGEAVGVVGESGSGKTTLARVMVGLQPPRSGQVHLEGAGIFGAGLRQRLPRAERWKIQMVFQDPYSSLNPRQRGWEAVAEALQVWQRLSAREAKAEALRLLGTMGVTDEQAHQFPASLSGGQRQRISVARALAPGPKILIADEPTSSIDQSAQAQLLNLFRQLQRERGLTLLFISHNLGIVRYLTSRVYVMQHGEIVESGATRSVFDHPQHAYTRSLLDAIPGRRARAELTNRAGSAHAASHSADLSAE